MCGSLHHVPGRPVLIEEGGDFAFTAVCYTTDRDGDGTVLADQITIDCGNGDSETVYNKHYMAYECEYDSPGTYTVECLVNDEITPIEPHCIDTFIIEEDDNDDPEFGVCGDGLPNDYEHCDLEQNNALIGDSLFTRENVANPFTDGDYVCRNCQIYKDDEPDTPTFPDDGSIIPECFYTDSTLSVQYDEVFPFWWDVEYDRVALTETCDGEEDY
jgi:hypothetical protein